MKRRTFRVVYVSYDGLADPLGQSQVLPYLRGLADLGHHIELVTFEKPGAELAFRKPLAPGLRWTGLRYHKDPTVPATLFDMAQGSLTVALARLLGRTDIVHTRSYVAGALVQPYLAVSKARFLFDMRGLWADERVEDGRWSETGRIFKAAKQIESHLVSRARAITVLTNSMQRYLRSEAPFSDRIRAPIWVIPTCTNLKQFNLQTAPKAELEVALRGTNPLVYCGSFGGRYLSDEMAQFYLAFRERVSEPRFLVVSKMEPTQIRSVLAQAGRESELVWASAKHDEVASHLRLGVAGVVFHPPTHTSRGVAPTKLGEMLACGLPCAGNLVGDVPRVLAEPSAGVVLEEFSKPALDEAAFKLAKLSRAADRAEAANRVAQRWFSLETGVRAYDELYQRMMGPGPDNDSSWPRA